MAIKDRVLEKLTAVEKELCAAAEKADIRALNDAYGMLSDGKSLCEKGLPKSRRGDYDELYDGLVFALGKLVGERTIDGKGEALALCGEYPAS